jgi:thiamine-phosphate pyrophosphorylase
MPHRHALPPLWLFTDARQGDAVWQAIARLPKGGAGVIVRTPELLDRIRALCRARRLLCVTSGPTPRRIGLSGSHGLHVGALTATAHNRRELVKARRIGVKLVFLSPVFPTRTHPDASALGPVRFGLLTANTRVALAALGGMTAKRFKYIRKFGAFGWGAIDALTRS